MFSSITRYRPRESLCWTITDFACLLGDSPRCTAAEFRSAFALLLIALLPLGARGDSPAAKRSVTIYRDTWGVPHIYAKTAADGAYGLGYAQAQDRLDDIYIAFRTGLGRLCEAFGKDKDRLQQDYIMRVCQNEELAKKYWTDRPPSTSKTSRPASRRASSGMSTSIPKKFRRSPSRSSRGTCSPSAGR